MFEYTHTQDPSYRRILVDGRQVLKILGNAQKEMNKKVVLSMKMFVFVPKIDDRIRYRNQDIQNIFLSKYHNIN